MKLKTFTGSNMTDIMRQIRAELGDDAVIVSNRTQDDGTLRISAAIEEEPLHEEIDMILDGVEDPSALFAGIADYGTAPEVSGDMEQHMATVTKALQRHSLPGFLFDKILSQCEQEPQGTAQQILARAFTQIFGFKDIFSQPHNKPVLLVGQPGAGKTTTIAKLATQAVMQGLKPVVVTTDTARAGGVEQLGALMRVLKLDLHQAHSPEQLKKIVTDAARADQILVDCSGINVFDAQAMKELHALIKATPMDLVVTLPGGIDVEEAAEIARALAILGAKYILPTRVDMSRRLGGLFAAADQAQLSFVGMGCRSDIANGFAPLDAHALAQLLVPQHEVKP